MATLENVRETLSGYRLTFELIKAPVPFVNALRRILLAEIPTVVIRDVVIRENTSQMIHEMLKHRVEMLPVNVKASEGDVIRDTKLTVRFSSSPEAREVTSDDFVANGPRSGVLLKDRDLGAPRLNDQIWLYGADKASIVLSISNARAGVMPSWGKRLDPAIINMLTVYVHSLGGGE
jgi:hypothetical protein